MHSSPRYEVWTRWISKDPADTLMKDEFVENASTLNEAIAAVNEIRKDPFQMPWIEDTETGESILP